MYSVKIASQNTIVITDRRLVKELMDKRGAISSDRPPAMVLDTMIYEGAQILVMNHSNPRLRVGRKLIHQHFMGTVVEEKHMPVINAEAAQLLRDMCIEPEQFLEHLKRLSNSMIMSICKQLLTATCCNTHKSIGYGFRTPTLDTPHFVKIRRVLANETKLLEPGALPPVDLFPFLHWVPERFFGNWMSRVKKVHFEMHDLHSENFGIVERRRAQEGSRETFADRLLDEQKALGWDRCQVYFLTGGIVEAGSDTTSHGMSTFIQMMAMYPEVTKNAQKEVDSVIGEDRTPIWDDFAKLPIVTAIIKETMRIRPIVPVAFPHALAEGS
jgi:cytochrome P450